MGRSFQYGIGPLHSFGTILIITNYKIHSLFLLFILPQFQKLLPMPAMTKGLSSQIQALTLKKPLPKVPVPLS